MFKNYFERIENVEVAPIVSLLIFFVFFVLLIYWVVKIDKRYVDHMKNMPIDSKNEPLSDKN